LTTGKASCCSGAIQLLGPENVGSQLGTLVAMVTCWNPGQQPCWNYIDFALYAKTLKNPFQPKLSGKISEVPILSC